jgi:RNA polymerase sigma-70 factor (ECF subfamily)
LQAADLADVFQEVFRSVAQSIGEFHRGGHGETFRGWLRTITRNKLHDYFRRTAGEPVAVGGSSANARWQQFVDDHEPDDLLPMPLDDERAVLVRRALDLLRTDFEEHSWRAFWRTAVDGLPAPEVAAELGMTAAAVRKAKSRVLQRLRTELGDTF